MDISVGGHHDGTFTSDFEYVKGSGDLDGCNGITVDGKYMYLVTKEFPYISRCLMGEFEEQRGPQREQNNRSKGRPSFSDLLEMMDINNDKKISRKEAKGPLRQDFNRIDLDKDGYLTEVELSKMQRSDRSYKRRKQ